MCKCGEAPERYCSCRFNFKSLNDIIRDELKLWEQELNLREQELKLHKQKIKETEQRIKEIEHSIKEIETNQSSSNKQSTFG